MFIRIGALVRLVISHCMEFKVLSEILDDLPVITDINGNDFKPVFDYGTQADLLKFLSLKKKSKSTGNVYPLVWLQTPVSFAKENEIEVANVNFVLATISDRNISNRTRTTNSFVQILDPLQASVEKAINVHEGTRVSRYNQDIMKYFNYENDLEKGATDIWDAISFRVNLEINLDCINY